MKTREIYEKNAVLMFHIGRGGRFFNQGHLSFVGSERIDECYDFYQNAFIRDFDENGEELPLNEQGLFGCSGHQLMNYEELQVAMDTGIGYLDFDGDYDTTYTTYLSSLDEEEYNTLDEDWKRIYLIVVNEFDEEKVNKIKDEDLDYLYDILPMSLDEFIEEEEEE